MFAVYEADGVKRLKISVIIDDDEALITGFDSTTGWSGYGDGTNIALDSFNYVKGNASLQYDISAVGGTTAGVVNSTLDPVDLTDFLNNGTIVVWAYITFSTNLTNFKLRIGSSASAYYEKTVTTSDGQAFQNGWNILKFDLTSLTTSGSPDITDITYVALFMTKDGAKISESGYKFDWMVAKLGDIYTVLYYSDYLWQTSAGVYIGDSTADTDLLNAGVDEYELLVLKAKELSAKELKKFDLSKEHAVDYKDMEEGYKQANPSEAKILTTDYYNFNEDVGLSNEYYNHNN
jgi:hypothetical protein